MAEEMEFPNNPMFGDTYTNTEGITYSWNGLSWITGFLPGSGVPGFTRVGDVLNQVRQLLMDLDASSGGYRYSTQSIVANINMGMLEMYRARPDIFLQRSFQVPQFFDMHLEEPIGIEQQYVPPLVYYAVGLTQARDDEETQDARASAFLAKFNQMLVAVV